MEATRIAGGGEGSRGRGAAASTSRIATRKKRTDILNNTASKLMQREVQRSGRSSRRTFCREHFQRMHVLEAFEPIQFGIGGLDNHVDINTEIVLIRKLEDIIFVIAKSGLCVVFNTVSKTRLGILNQEDKEKIRKLHFNDCDGSILIISTIEESARCHSIHLEMVKTGNFHSRKGVFGTLTVPVFVNCHNGLAVVCSAPGKYDVFDLHDYSLVYSIHHGEGLQSFPEGILIWCEEAQRLQRLRVHSIVDGTLIKQFLVPADSVTQSCIIKDHLLYNDESGNSYVLDMCADKVKRLQSNELKAAEYKCLPRSNRILATENRQTYSVWELNMEEVKRKDAKKDKKLLRHGKDMELLCQGPYTLHEGSKSANVLVIHGDGIVVSYYKPTDGSSRGSITVTDIQSGQIVCDIVDNVTPGPMANIDQIVDSICTMYYDEDKENLYTGTIDGAFQIWGA